MGQLALAHTCRRLKNLRPIINGLGQTVPFTQLGPSGRVGPDQSI